jgi:16S rRNA (adenine1518-N6/adenine1519-N6)-dimethyltransferase
LQPFELKKVRVVVRTAFSQRRKQLRNTLSSLSPNLCEVLDRLAIDPRRRPETLTVAEFVAISRALREQP